MDNHVWWWHRRPACVFHRRPACVFHGRPACVFDGRPACVFHGRPGRACSAETVLGPTGETPVPPSAVAATVRLAALVGLMVCSRAMATPSKAKAEPPAAPPARIGEAAKDAAGLLVHTVESPYQAGRTKLRVLLPDRLERGNRYRVVYVLPVEALDGNRYGDGLAEVRKLDLHNTHRLICVYPTFSHTPWYADHPSDPNVRQESHLLKVVLPFVERTYPAMAGPRGRLLLGFSKSGWGAWSLLLRHPDVFGKAAAWDAPLTKARPDQWGMRPIFGTQANFAKYHVPSLLDRAPGRLGKRPRLALLGYGNFRAHHVRTREKLLALKVPHRYQDGPRRNHHWAGGWVREAVEFLAGPDEPPKGDRPAADPPGEP